MIRHVWSVFCSSSAIDRDTNQVSLFDTIEQIAGSVSELPPAGEKVVIPGRFQLVTLWTRGVENEPERALARMRLLGPTGDELLKSENEVNLTEHRGRRVRMNLVGLPYSTNGEHHLLVEIRGIDNQWHPCADIPLGVKITGPPATAEAAVPGEVVAE